MKSTPSTTQPSPRHSITRFLAVSALALALPLSAVAADRCVDRGAGKDGAHAAFAMHHRQGMMPDLRGIDLSAAQVAQLSALRDDQRKTFGEKGLALREQHDALHKLVMSDSYTPAAAAEIIGKIETLQSEMAKAHAEQSHKIYALLTPEQRTRMQQNALTGPTPMGPKGGRGRG